MSNFKNDYIDVDDNSTMGVAVVGVDEQYGRWQYSCNQTGSTRTWHYFVGDTYESVVTVRLPRPDKATLLADYCRIRFLPNIHFNSEFDTLGNTRTHMPFVRLLGWDQTSTVEGVGRYGVNTTLQSASIIGEFGSTIRTAEIDVVSVNDAPILHLNGTASENYETTFVEDLLGVPAVSRGLTLIDNDHAFIHTVTLQIVNVSRLSDVHSVNPDWSGRVPDNTSDDDICNGASLRREKLLVDLSNTKLNSTVRSYCPYVLELSAESPSGALVSDFEKALLSTIYNNSLEEPNPADRLIVVSVFDGVGWSQNVYTLLHIQLVNDNPILDLNGPGPDDHFFVNYTEGDVAVPLVDVDALSLTDHDDGLLEWVRISLNDSPDDHHELINVTLVSENITAEFDVDNNTLLLSGSASVQEYESVLRSATYTNTFANVGFPSDRDRRIDFVVSDGRALSRTASSYIYFTRVNDRPFLDLNGAVVGQDFATRFREEMGPVSLCTPDVEVFDIDNTTLAFITVEITNIMDGASEVLSVSTVVESQVESYNAFSQEKVRRRVTLTPNVTYDAVNGLMIIRGLDTLSEYAKVLATLTYNNLKDEPDFTTRSIRISLNDGLLESVNRTTTVTVTPENDSPRLSLTAPIYHHLIDEDVAPSRNRYFTVQQMASPLIEDDDANSPEGVAIVAINNTNGKWRYQTLGVWRDIPPVSMSMALLIGAMVGNNLRFEPNADYHGPTTLEFVAWDGSNGLKDGDLANATSASHLDPFSDNRREFELTVVPVNDAPLLDSSVQLRLTTIREDSVAERNNSGDDVSILLRAWGGDVDVPVVRDRGVAIISVDNSNGYWQFTTNAGLVWQNMGTPTNASALVLGSAPSGSNRVRFVPNKDFNGGAWLEVKMWDRNSSEASGTLNVNTLTSDPVTGTFSTTSSVALLTIDPVNDSPVLTGNSELFAIDEDPIINLGTPVQDIVNNIWVDIDGVCRGVAVNWHLQRSKPLLWRVAVHL